MNHIIKHQQIKMKTSRKHQTQADFIYINIYIKNDIFDAFNKDYLDYKRYVNDILNTLIPKDDISQ